MAALIDRYGRAFPYLRWSLLEACNVRCSRARAVQLGNCLVLARPGSPRAVVQAFDILAPAPALATVAGKDHA